MVAAILPNVASAVMETSSPDYSDDECARFSCSNLFWSCHPASPSLDCPLTVKGLIDDGSSIVLIRESVARRLKLPILQASDPFQCQAAFSNDKTALSLSSYIKIRPFSSDGHFSSRTLRAFISPTLVTNLILGLPFLNSYGLVVDHGHGSCIVKLDNSTSYDLLRTSGCVPSKPTLRWKMGHTRASEVRAARWRARPAIRDILLGEEMTARLRPRLNVHPSRGQCGSRLNNIIAALKERIQDLNAMETFEAQLKHMDGEMKRKYADLFPDDIPPVHQLPDMTYHRFILKDVHKIIRKREYACPRKWQDTWHTLLDGHLAAGRMRPSDSEYSSPAFLVPKADPNAMPQWVNDYRELNENTVVDKFPLPRIADILADCGRGKIWGKLDMTNTFFQTKVHPDHIKYTAVRTPFGLYEWVVMPQGCRNAPSTHQRRMVAALRPWIGKICHVYLDDIIIWSANLAEHIRNVETILQALRAFTVR
ncbi:hypothetical protein CCMSSC00406_0008473 [Pleurotus cornucopiae]|uniref:Uncharacterized protein n=1 Tax=Pleurotus cornucopiae TaxID=5321 RepID=A0ACB7II24_PLECO|nr:hypothetical protein CCMSSC00406_0008473 [Pleurotus cornucopiae]